MSESSTATDQLSPIAELGAAFQTAADQQQKDDEGKQNEDQGAEPKDSPDSSDPPSTPPSSSDADKSREELLSSLTLAEIKSHSTLGKLLQSEVDTTAARMLSGQTKAIEERVRREVTLEQAKAHFDSLSEEDLGDELAQNPQARELYGLIAATPPPPPPVEPTAAAAIQYFTRMVREYDGKLTSSGLPPEVVASLNPQTHLVDNRDPNLDGEAVLSAWIAKVDQAIIDHKVGTGKTDESKLIEGNADRDEKPGGALLQNGRLTSPLPDFDKTSGSALLADAVQRSARPARR